MAESRDQSDIVEVYAAQDDAQAHLLRAYLLDAGIESRVVGETLLSGLTLGSSTAPRLWVRRQDFEPARRLITEWESLQEAARPTRPAGPEWICPTCGEAVETEYDVCWNCMTPRKPY